MSRNKIESKIIHASNLEEFKQTIDKADQDTLIVFDIDEVIITSKDQILHPSFIVYRDKLYEDVIVKDHTKSEIEALSSIIFKTYETILVDENILKIFQNIYDNRLKVLALTSSPTGKLGVIEKFEDHRVDQLKRVGIDFNKFIHSFSDVILHEMKSECGTPLLHNGIIYTCHIDKGSVLEKILKKLDLKFKKIIFIDDRLDNLTSVESMCIKSEIDFFGFEYTAVRDSFVSPFNETRAQFQFNTLIEEGNWLSDELADIKLAG